MHYIGYVHDEERQIDVREVSPDKFMVTIDERTFEVDAKSLSESTLSLILNNEAYCVESEEAEDGGDNLLVRGQVVHVDVLDLRKVRLREAQASAESEAGPTSIKSPMPGKVVAILVKDGQEVKKGEGLVVVEAMKMENELKSPKDGIVKEITAVEGAAVDGGVALCLVE